jgi:hypothetical protein
MAATLIQVIRTLVAPPSATAVSDRDLLGRFVTRGDEAAFTALVKRHGPMVLRVCRRILRGPSDTEDAFQATFLALPFLGAKRPKNDSKARDNAFDLGDRVADCLRAAVQV